MPGGPDSDKSASFYKVFGGIKDTALKHQNKDWLGRSNFD